AVAVDPHHVDIARPVRDAFLQDPGALVDHRVDHALDDFLFVDRPARNAGSPRRFDDDLLDLGIGRRGARARLVDVIAFAGFLAEAPRLAQRVGNFRAHAAGAADAPADVE